MPEPLDSALQGFCVAGLGDEGPETAVYLVQNRRIRMAQINIDCQSLLYGFEGTSRITRKVLCALR